MVNWFNQQNKEHFALFRENGALNWRDENLTWMDILLAKRSERLNIRVSKLSPRRGKKEAKKRMKELLDTPDDQFLELEHIHEFVEIEEELNE